MKKIFLFATIAAAGLFASCSSSDDAVSEAPNNPIVDAEGNPAIKIGIANIANMTTRGTGTVGGVNTGDANVLTDNVWAGQKIKVFMFNKDKNPVYADPADPSSGITGYEYVNTLTPAKNQGVDMYNNTTMITPGADANKIPGMGATAQTESGEAMIEDGTIQYYPVEGNFNFYGYHGDDAVADNAEITKTATKWTVPFTITGAQDLMSTKAELTAAQAAVMTGDRANDYYSAYSARKATPVQPTLTFKHLLTRFAFKVVAGNKDAAGWVEATNDEVSTVTAAQYDQLDATGKGQCVAKDYTPKAGDDGKLTDAEFAALGDQSNWDNTNDNAHEWTGTDPLAKAAYDLLTAAEKYKFDVANYTRTIPGAAAHQELAKAVKVTNIQINSKNTGNMAVAWIGDNDDVTGYDTGNVLPQASYDAITTGADTKDQRWTPVDANDLTQGYQWAGPALDAAGYAALDVLEKAVINELHGNQFTDANKIVWNDGTDWLTLKERPYYKKKANAAAAEYADFTDGATLNTAVTTAATALTTAEGEYEAAVLALNAIDQQNDPDGYAAQEVVVNTKLAAKNAAQTAKDEADAALQALLDLETATISETVWNQLSADGKLKYDDVHTANLNVDLTDLTPTAPEYDPNGATPADKFPRKDVGEALIVAPKDNGDYDMRVTIKQDVPLSWIDTNALTTKEVSYDLTIKAPDGGFKQNYSYNVILTVYSLTRIKVVAVITPWADTADDVEIGGDE